MSEIGSSRARTILLVVSLCLNVLLIAVVAVGVGRMLGRGMPPPGFSPQGILREVPPEDRAHILAVMAGHRAAMRSARIAAMRARDDAFQSFTAPDFTPAAFARSLAAVRAADAALEAEATATLGDVVAALTPAEREAVIERRRMHRPPFWRRRMMGPPPPSPGP